MYLINQDTKKALKKALQPDQKKGLELFRAFYL